MSVIVRNMALYLKAAAARLWNDIRAIWAEPQVHGLERYFDGALLVLRFGSISYWLRAWSPPADSAQRTVRDTRIDIYCTLQLIVLAVLVVLDCWRFVDSFIVGYILFEIYLNLLNIVFIGKFPQINPPPASVERSILLLLVNIVQVVLGFGILYHHCSELKLSRCDGVSQAILVLGTVGYPQVAETPNKPATLVSLQILLDILLLVLVVSSFVGQLGLFSKKKCGCSDVKPRE